MRYDNTTWENKLYVPSNMDDYRLLVSTNYGYHLDENTGNLHVRNNINHEDIMVITTDGKIVIKIKISVHGYVDRQHAFIIQALCRTVFGYSVYMLTRYKKHRLYVYPDKDGWTNWDADPDVKKYVLTDNKAVILDISMNILHGATPQKNPSNTRATREYTPRGQKETDW